MYHIIFIDILALYKKTYLNIFRHTFYFHPPKKLIFLSIFFCFYPQNGYRFICMFHPKSTFFHTYVYLSENAWIPKMMLLTRKKNKNMAFYFDVFSFALKYACFTKFMWMLRTTDDYHAIHLHSTTKACQVEAKVYVDNMISNDNKRRFLTT